MEHKSNRTAQYNLARKQLNYIDINEKNASKKFANSIYYHIKKLSPGFDSIVILCIGTDRSTGDSFGPLIGHMLKKPNYDNVTVYGNLEHPVHAKNLAETIAYIYNTHNSPLVVAIDACLGKVEHIGYLTVGEGSIHPGAGVNKELPAIGDIFITGIVNFTGVMDMLILQNTRLNLVMKMADTATRGLNTALKKLKQNLLNTESAYADV